jgi:hypothetical protein
MAAVEKTIPAKAKNPKAPVNVRFKEFISCLRLVWRRKNTLGVLHKENGLAASSVEVKFSSVS